MKNLIILIALFAVTLTASYSVQSVNDVQNDSCFEYAVEQSYVHSAETIELDTMYIAIDTTVYGVIN